MLFDNLFSWHAYPPDCEQKCGVWSVAGTVRSPILTPPIRGGLWGGIFIRRTRCEKETYYWVVGEGCGSRAHRVPDGAGHYQLHGLRPNDFLKTIFGYLGGSKMCITPNGGSKLFEWSRCLCENEYLKTFKTKAVMIVDWKKLAIFVHYY